MLRALHFALFLCSAVIASGCATSYRFISSPEGAAVYYVTGGQKTLLGETPIDYSKSILPQDAPFVLKFEKSGYETKEIAVTPTDNALTTVTVQLLPGQTGTSDASLKRMRSVINQIFQIQEQMFQRKYVDALASLKVLENTEAQLPELYVLRGSVYLAMGDEGQARKEWERALALDPTLDSLKVRLAKLPRSDGGKLP